MKKINLEYLTSLDVIRLLWDRRAIFREHGEGVGKLLEYGNKVYYQEGDKFYLNSLIKEKEENEK